MDISTDEREAKMEPGDHIHDNSGLEQKGDHSEPILRPSDVHLAEEKIENEKSDIQPTTLPQSLPRKKSAEHAIPGDEEAPGSDHARIERLGRERPAKFKSSVAEFTFCYSVIASLFMTVRSMAATLSKEIALTLNLGVLCIWLQCHPTELDQRPLYTASFCRLACKCLRSGLRGLLPPFRPSCRYVWWISNLPIWLGLVYSLVYHRGFFPERFDAGLLPGTSRAGPGCFPSVRCDVDGKHIQTRAPEEFCVQYLRRRRSFRIFPWYLRRRRDW